MQHFLLSQIRYLACTCKRAATAMVIYLIKTTSNNDNGFIASILAHAFCVDSPTVREHWYATLLNKYTCKLDERTYNVINVLAQDIPCHNWDLNHGPCDLQFTIVFTRPQDLCIPCKLDLLFSFKHTNYCWYFSHCTFVAQTTVHVWFEKWRYDCTCTIR